jgi:hypothetical protein
MRLEYVFRKIEPNNAKEPLSNVTFSDKGDSRNGFALAVKGSSFARPAAGGIRPATLSSGRKCPASKE